MQKVAATFGGGNQDCELLKDPRPGAAAPHERRRISNAPPRAVRHKLQEERASITHKFNIGGHEGYITVGLYPNGDPGELFVTMAKEGSTVSGLMDSFALAVSIALQHGVSLKLFCEKFAHTRFEPSGWSGNPDIGYAKSIMDYIFRWLQLRFIPDSSNCSSRICGRSCRGSARSRQRMRRHAASGSRKPGARSRFDPRCRRAGRHHRPGRRSHLQLLRQHHDAKRFVLSLRELREHERVQLAFKCCHF